MRDVSNEVLALWAKRVRVSGQDLTTVDLGPAREVEVSPLPTYGRVRYYQYSDGQTERLVISTLPEQFIFRPLVRPSVEVRSVWSGGLELGMRAGPGKRSPKSWKCCTCTRRTRSAPGSSRT